MRRSKNRQARREAVCFSEPRPRGNELPISPRRISLTADGDDLVEVAARIAEELELSLDLIELLSTPPLTR